MKPNMTPGKPIKRTDEDADMSAAIVRAITAPFNVDDYVDQASTDYHRLDVEDALSLAVDEEIPVQRVIPTVANVHAMTHEWLEQEHPRSPTVTFRNSVTDPSGGIGIVPTRYSNQMARLGVDFSMADVAQVVAQSQGLLAVGPDEMGRQLAAKVTELARDRELAFWEGVQSTAEPYGFRGILGDYKNANRNGFIGGVETRTSIDVAGAELTENNVDYWINKVLYTIKQLHVGGMPNTLWVNPRALTIITAAASKKVTVFMTQSELANMSAMNLGGKVGIYYSNFGFLEIYSTPDLILADATPGSGTNIPANSRFVFLNTSAIRFGNFSARPGFVIQPRAKSNASEERIIDEWLTLEVRKLGTHGELRNFYSPDVAPTP